MEDTFVKRWKAAPAFQKVNYKRLTSNLHMERLTDKERRYLLWLSQYDFDTIYTFKGIFEAIKKD